ncbi:class I SAM-dependent methyltransferase [Porphyromonadaceae bacterium OttesenSCG-928-L07]|nr:class I SAM-dependent methyltransferase [Porphyromonadaceae bacterium OttesenSCG-928-L07]MDL2331091.1 class I SAM-dependent methyltransferase [Odoribacter sp. OttesenSCG-928-A06]
MELFPALNKVYTKEQLSARDAQRLAEFIAFGPIVFQVSRLMIKFGILDLLRDSEEGLTRTEISEKTGLSDYAVKVMTDASLTIGSILVDTETDRFSLSKTGWFLLNDPATRVNMDFNHDVNYIGFFNLEEALLEGKPAGLKHFGNWPTVYEGLSQLPEQVQKSWFGFDHFYSDGSFDEALDIVFANNTRTLLDVGGNTGRWALRCVGHNPEVKVTIMDLPQQLEMMKEQTKGKPGFERIDGFGANLLDEKTQFPKEKQFDAIWMSQFLDCFSEEEIIRILSKAKEAMTPDTRLYIMETFWERQKYEPAAFCLTQISLYFTAIANGNSKMYHSEDMRRFVETAGLKVEKIHDHLGQGHSIMICKL